MKRTYGSKRGRVKVLDHQDIFLNCDNKESLFEALSIQNIKQYKREASCLGSSCQVNTPIRGVRKRKRVMKTLNISKVNEMIQESKSTYLTPDKSIHVRREEDLFDQLKDPNPIIQDSRDANMHDPFGILIPRKSPNKKKNFIRPKVEYNKSSDTDCSSKENLTIPRENVLQHELLIEKSNKNTYNNSDSINKLINNASLLNKFTNSNSYILGAKILQKSNIDLQDTSSLVKKKLCNSITDKENISDYSQSTNNLESKEEDVSSKKNSYKSKVILRKINVRNRLTKCHTLNKNSPLTSTPLNKKKMETSLHNFSPILLNNLSLDSEKRSSMEKQIDTNCKNDTMTTNVAYKTNLPISIPQSLKDIKDKDSMQEINAAEKSFLTVEDSMYDTCNSFHSLNSDDSKSFSCKENSNSDEKVNEIVEDLTNLSFSETKKQHAIELLFSPADNKKQNEADANKNLSEAQKSSEIKHSIDKKLPKVNVTRLRKSILEKHLSKKTDKSRKLKQKLTEDKDKEPQLMGLHISLKDKKKQDENLCYLSTKLKESKNLGENDLKKICKGSQYIDPNLDVTENYQHDSLVDLSITKGTSSAHCAKSNLETINECVCANEGLTNNNLGCCHKTFHIQNLSDKKVPRVNVKRLRKSTLEKYLSKESRKQTILKQKYIEEKLTKSCMSTKDEQNINEDLSYSLNKFKQSKNHAENCEGLQKIDLDKIVKVNVNRLKKSIVEKYLAINTCLEVENWDNSNLGTINECVCDYENDVLTSKSSIMNESKLIETPDENNSLEFIDSNKKVAMTEDINTLDETLRETGDMLNHSPKSVLYKSRETLVPYNSDDVSTGEPLNVSAFVTKRRKNYANDDTLFIPLDDSDDQNRNEPMSNEVWNLGSEEMRPTSSCYIAETIGKTNKSQLDIYDDSAVSKSPIIGSSMKNKKMKNKKTKQKVSIKEIKTDVSSNNCSNIEHNEIARPIVLLPGKKWERSLSIYRRMTQMQNSCVEGSLLDETAVRGRKYRESIQHFIKNQQSAATPTGLQPNDSALNRRSSVLGKPRRSTIRVVKDTSTSRSSIISSACGIEDAFCGFISDDCDDTLIDLSRLSISDLENEITVLEKDVSHVNTARDFVLRRCNQSRVLPFSECYPDSVLKNCRKVGEGVYGEVFLYRGQNGRPRIMKIVPVAGDTTVNGEQQKSFHEIISEIIIAMELSALRTPIEEFEKKINIEGNISDFDFSAVEHATDTFNEVLEVKCVQGAYPARLLDLWELYDETNGSENDSPCSLPEDQQYIVLELSNAGQDLESFEFNNAEQAYALFYQVAFALAVGEEAFQFEHRDLHWGNVLIAPTDQKYGVYVLGGRGHLVARRGVCATIIDYSLSRISFPLGAEHATQLYNNLADDESLFEAVGDYQFDVYRLMRQKTGNNWENFEPYTNILWLHYTLDKMITALRYKRTNTKIHKHYINKLKSLRDVILDYSSAVDFVLSNKQ